jgi:membrane protease YdiL (CAAX protease family)
MKQSAGVRSMMYLASTPSGLSTALVIFALLSILVIWAGMAAPHIWMFLVLAPLAEEAVFRAGVQEALLRHRTAPWTANVMTALMFGLAHAALRGDWGGLAVAAPALLIGAMYGRWRRLRLCVGLHAAMNALWLAWGLTSLHAW